MQHTNLTNLRIYGSQYEKVIKYNITTREIEYIYPESAQDSEEDQYLQYLNLDLIADFMRQCDGKERLEMDVRCVKNEKYEPLFFEIVAAKGYTTENQSVYIYIYTSKGVERRILIVEDNELVRELISDFISTHYEVIAVEHGKKALEVLREQYENIAIVVTDLNMPVMDGYELIRHMKDDERFHKIPIIVTSGVEADADKNLEEVEQNCMQLGAVDFMPKPYNAEVVLNRIMSFIRLHEASSQYQILERDSLTGLFSKEFFFARVEEFLKVNTEEDYVMWASDIVDLKVINEKYGFAMGDTILKMQAGDRGRFKGFCFGGRIEGDKFAALIKEKDLDQIIEITKEHDMGIKFPVPGVVIKHGFYHIKRDTNLHPQGMYDRALLAVQKIKNIYGVYSAEYDDDLRKELLIRRQINEDAEKALEEHQFEVYYQPKHDLKAGRTNGAEALIRWNHPDLGFLSPGLFIPIFEQNCFIRKLDLYVWEEVCKLLMEWKNVGKRMMPISINASRRDFDDKEFADKAIAIVDRYGINHQYFHIEITESAYSDNPEKIERVIHTFHKQGFVVELDDFGSGYSSMTALCNLNLDVMKLDMSIIQNDEPGSDRNILEFSMQLAKLMKLKTVAEGVETRMQVERIVSLGGDYIQGYYFSKPLPKAEFEKYLEQEEGCS